MPAVLSDGKVTMHGTVKSDTFVRLAREPKAGDTTLLLEKPVTGWKAGDKLAMPDTRQLGLGQTNENYVPEWEFLTLSSVSADGSSSSTRNFSPCAPLMIGRSSGLVVINSSMT